MLKWSACKADVSTLDTTFNLLLQFESNFDPSSLTQKQKLLKTNMMNLFNPVKS